MQNCKQTNFSEELCHTSATCIFVLSLEIQILQANKNSQIIILFFEVSLQHLYC